MIQIGQQQVNGGARQARLAPSEAFVRIRLHLVSAGAKKTGYGSESSESSDAETWADVVAERIACQFKIAFQTRR
jgi:hypothetical protein